MRGVNRIDALLNMADEELMEFFRTALDTHADPDLKRRIEDRRKKIQSDFEKEWSREHLKWLFKRSRQKKLLRRIELRYPPLALWLIEDTINSVLPDTTEFFGEYVDFKGECDNENQ